MVDSKRFIMDLQLEELQEYFVATGEKKFRAKQVWEWLYVKGAESFEAMSNLSKDLRQKLAGDFEINPLGGVRPFRSREDETVKYLVGLRDGNQIETVQIPGKERLTVCVSSQVGCKAGCIFCASGAAGFVRNLSVGEIVAQVMLVARKGKSVTNVVFMGIGEPFDNYDNVTGAIRVINNAAGLNIGARRITVSTVGIVPQFERFAEFDLQAELAISLHAPEDKLRSRLVPANRRYSLVKIMDACREYIRRTNRQITFEYVLLHNINDLDEHARMLAHMLKGMLCKVNLIPFNSHEMSDFETPSPKRVERFAQLLSDNRIVTTVRASKGRDIKAACGQLRCARG